MVAQTGLAVEVWPSVTPLQVRMGVHSGEADERGGDFFGAPENRAARVMSVARGRQVRHASQTAPMRSQCAIAISLTTPREQHDCVSCRSARTKPRHTPASTSSWTTSVPRSDGRSRLAETTKPNRSCPAHLSCHCTPSVGGTPTGLKEHRTRGSNAASFDLLQT